MKARPVLLSIKPHDGVGGCVPRPKKLNEASIRMAFPSQMEAMIRIGAVTFGRICADDHPQVPAPESPCRFDIRVLFGGQHGSTHDARIARNDHHGDRQHGVRRAGCQHRNDGQGQNQPWDRHDGIHHPLQCEIEPSFPIAAMRPDNRARQVPMPTASSPTQSEMRAP